MTEEMRQLGREAEYKSCILQENRKVRQAVSIARLKTDRVHIINEISPNKPFTAAAIALGWAGTPLLSTRTVLIPRSHEV